MADYSPSEWTKPLTDDKLKELVGSCTFLSPDKAQNVLDNLIDAGISDPQQVLACLLHVIPHAPERRKLQQAVAAEVGQADRYACLSVCHGLADALACQAIMDMQLDAGGFCAADPNEIATAARQQFEKEEEWLYKRHLHQILCHRGLGITCEMMDKLYGYLIEMGMSLDSPDLVGQVFDFFKDPAAQPRRRPRWTVPLSDLKRKKVFDEFPLLEGDAQDVAHQHAVRGDVRDPLKVRAIAVEAAVPGHMRRELLRAIRSALSLDGGSSHLRGFPKLSEAIFYEYVVDNNTQDLKELCDHNIKCPLRAFAEKFFRENRHELYKERIRESLRARGFSIDDQRLDSTYRHMVRRRIPLPVRRQGAIR
jgi:hypothetical protein